jgi:hypothetical protein
MPKTIERLESAAMGELTSPEKTDYERRSDTETLREQRALLGGAKHSPQLNESQ